MGIKLYNDKARVAVLMGSKSDFDAVKPCLKIFKELDVEFEARIISAHRTPEEAMEFASCAEAAGIEVIIGVAGKAAHLAGVIAAHTVLPVIALPIQTSMMGGLDSLLSMVQMPAGIPVATVGVNAGENAGLLAAQMLGVKDAGLKQKLFLYKKRMREKINKDDGELQKELSGI